ncbi:MAG: YfiR family protein [Alphaproteobacteria bacterium]|nr:YfiR family protein [Alphaproteobacteria bacterium]
MARALPLIAARLLRGLFAASLLALSGPAPSQPSEAAVKAAFLGKFPAYVGWPAESRPAAGEPIILCLIGGDPFGKLIDDAVRGQQIDRHPIQVKRIPRPDDGAGCALAFVAGASTIEAMKGKPVLTVTDSRNSAQRGMIHFVVDQGRVRFHIDQAAAVRSRLAINSRLLALALTVKKD